VGMPCGNHNYVLLCCGIHVCFSVSMFCDFLNSVIVCCLCFSVWLLVCFVFSRFGYWYFFFLCFLVLIIGVFCVFSLWFLFVVVFLVVVLGVFCVF